jgi:hypothetical protein
MSENQDYSHLSCDQLIGMAVERSLVDDVEPFDDSLALTIGSLTVQLDEAEACLFVRGLLRGHERTVGRI